MERLQSVEDALSWHLAKEERLREVDMKVKEVERQAQEVDMKTQEAERQAREADKRTQEAERQAQEAKRQAILRSACL